MTARRRLRLLQRHLRAPRSHGSHGAPHATMMVAATSVAAGVGVAVAVAAAVDVVAVAVAAVVAGVGGHELLPVTSAGATGLVTLN